MVLLKLMTADLSWKYSARGADESERSGSSRQRSSATMRRTIRPLLVFHHGTVHQVIADPVHPDIPGVRDATAAGSG